MARLAIRKDVLRNLGILSKNNCAFPGCDQPILDDKGNYVAELCHIEAAESGGPRYNPTHSDEDRRALANLLFLCHPHHKETDDESLYPVDRLQEMKAKHEALPEVVFNHELLMQRVETVLAEQNKISEFLGSGKARLPTQGSFPIHGPRLRDAWTPEEGRFYEEEVQSGSRFKFMMKDGWLHIEQTLHDGAVAYYEVNEQGSVRNSRMPYPISEYSVEIPESVVLSRETVSSRLGTHAIRTTLRWSAGTVTEHFQGNLFVGADCATRCSIDHETRTIRVMDLNDA